MNAGKKKCELLKRIRKEVAERYGLEYDQSECTNQGDCNGTCPRCDAELEELQRQLAFRGIDNLDILNLPIEPMDDENDISVLEGDVSVPSDNKLTSIVMGMPAVPYIVKEKTRVLYKECKIAGITFHDLKDIWDEFYVGAKLVLIRDKKNKYDKYAIAVALADDYDGDPDNFDFDFILGYVPKGENEYLATMMDLGWADAFECELSQVNGSNPYKGSLYMKIYMVSKEEKEVVDTRNLMWVLKLDKNAYINLTYNLSSKGCTCFRWGGFPPWEQTYPNKGEKVVFMYDDGQSVVLYQMYCIAVGNDEASFFVEDKNSLFVVDDSCYYVFTNIKGPIQVQSSELEFLNSENINTNEPELILSEYISFRLKDLFDSI